MKVTWTALGPTIDFTVVNGLRFERIRSSERAKRATEFLAPNGTTHKSLSAAWVSTLPKREWVSNDVAACALQGGL